ncbi:pseudaminic acid biosynthesis N-acetyl transferase [Calditerrivibrio nitroreducens DSM 19672]|uniref:Pseudaminic acid biosynthesis N-acetyl transferase n=2 Tax=Calditerrivibrio nitroreducens TaxID=477976 RepID=E4TGF2_CALNY|nr:pseudaminic acid biosynthesis N-acetyl transferase [Calditerrivibrio nitroreducens DSM 19672]
MCNDNLKQFYYEGLDFIDFTIINSEDKHSEILAIRNNDSIRKYMYNDKIITLEEHIQFVNSLKKDNTKRYWAAYEYSTFVGSINLTEIDWVNKRAKLGIYTNQSIKGVGVKLLNTLKWIAFEKFSLNCLRLEVLANNIKAISFYEKNQFKLEGVLREYVLQNESYLDSKIYSILRKEYYENNHGN